MMTPTCDYYFGKDFTHLGTALATSALSAEYLDIHIPVNSPIQYIINFIILFVLLVGVMVTRPGSIEKYSLFIGFAIWLGQTLKPFWIVQEERSGLTKALAMTASVFVGMMAVGFYDNQNLLGFGTYLLAGLFALIIAQVAVYFMASVEDKKTALNWLRLFGIGLFAIFTAYDVQLIKANKSICGGLKKLGRVPDYPNESLGLYFDFINLFAKIGNN